MENSNYEYEHPLTEKDKETVQQDFSNLQVEVNKVIENSKYYAPSIEEFHVGFEYEIWYSCAYTPELWEKETLELYKGEDLNMLADGCHQLRVKYLDQSDIEEAGLERMGNFVNKFWPKTYFRLNQVVENITFTWYLHYHYKHTTSFIHNNISIYKEDRCRTKDENGNYKRRCIFEGTIKNKSELKQLMKWLNIN